MTTHEQVQTMGGEPLILDTAHGPILIHRVLHQRRKLRFELPDGVWVSRGMGTIEKRSPWVELVNGVVIPKHRLLQSLTDDSGGLIRLEASRPVRVLCA